MSNFWGAVQHGYSFFVYIEDLSNNQKNSVLPITKIIELHYFTY